MKTVERFAVRVHFHGENEPSYFVDDGVSVGAAGSLSHATYYSKDQMIQSGKALDAAELIWGRKADIILVYVDATERYLAALARAEVRVNDIRKEIGLDLIELTK